jgi:hypothetical protein
MFDWLRRLFGGEERQENTASNSCLKINKILPFIDGISACPVMLADGYAGILIEKGRCAQGTNYYIEVKDGKLGVRHVILPSLEWGVYIFHPDPLGMALGHGSLQCCLTSQGEEVPWGTNGLGNPALITTSGENRWLKSRVKDLENRILQLTRDLARQAVEDNNLKKQLGITQTITTKEDEENNEKKR